MSDGEFIGPIEVDLKPKHKLALMVRLTSVYNARLHICFLHGCNLFTCNYMKIMSKCLLYREQVCVCVKYGRRRQERSLGVLVFLSLFIQTKTGCDFGDSTVGNITASSGKLHLCVFVHTHSASRSVDLSSLSDILKVK